MGVSDHSQDQDGVTGTDVDIIIDDDADQSQSQTDGGLAAEDLGGADDDTLAYAREQGWRPRSEWRGNPREWADAKSFADRSLGINAILRKTNAELRRKYDADLAVLRADIATFQQGALAAAEARIAEQETELRARRAQAVNDGDGAEFDRLERDLDKLNRDKANLKAAPKPGDADKVNPAAQAAVQAFVDARPWLKSPETREDRRKATLFNAVGAEVREDSPELIGQPTKFLTEVERRAQEEYPDVFTAPSRASRVDTGGRPGGGTGKPKGRTYDNLPAAAKEACDRMVRTGMLKKKEDYVKNFDWSAA